MVASLDSRLKAVLAARAALEKQAEDVLVIDLRALSSVTDFFVICTGTSTRHLDALKDHLEAQLEQQGQPPWHVEGPGPEPHGSAHPAAWHWILMDCGDIVVHLFDAPARTFYQLERLWADAPRLSLQAG